MQDSLDSINISYKFLPKAIRPLLSFRIYIYNLEQLIRKQKKVRELTFVIDSCLRVVLIVTELEGGATRNVWSTAGDHVAVRRQLRRHGRDTLLPHAATFVRHGIPDMLLSKHTRLLRAVGVR